MYLKEIREEFRRKLIKLYPPEETDSLFILAAEYSFKTDRIHIHNTISKNTPPGAEKKMLAVLKRLQMSEPIQYILGYTYFYDLFIIVNPDVLIPRQETEYLVDIVLKNAPKYKKISVIDLCTGSGCIGISLAKNLSGSKVAAMDISQKCIDTAMLNAGHNNVSLEFITDNILCPAAEYGKYDLIVSNPPYVRNSEQASMHQNVLAYEPHTALFVSDDDPLIFYRAIISFSQKHLLPAGKIYLEINEAMSVELKNLFTQAGFKEITIIKDLDGKDRYLMTSNRKS